MGEAGLIILEEIAAIEGGAKEAYLEAVRTKLAPLLDRRAGARLLFVGSTIGSTGAWPEAVALFELDDWQAWGRLAAAFAAPDDRELRAWREESAPLRARAQHRTLVPWPFSPSLAELRRCGVEGKAFSFVRYRAAAGRSRELGDAVERLAAVERSAGRELVGGYEVAFGEGEVSVVWAHRDLSAITARTAKAPPGVAEWIAESRDLVVSIEEHWAFATPGGPLWPRNEATNVKVW